MSIDRITVKGYKSLKNERSIELKQLTVIAGANSSGKSSIMQPLLLLKQTLDASYDPGPLLLDGANVNITSMDQILSKGKSKTSQVANFSLGINHDDNKFVSLKFGRKGPKGAIKLLEVERDFGIEGESSFVIREGMSEREIAEVIPSDLYSKYGHFAKSFEDRGIELFVVRDRSFLDLAVRVGTVSRNSGSFVPLSSLILDEFSTEALQSEVARIIHLPALRGNPLRTYRTVAVEGTYPGTFETYTAGIISAWQSRGDEEKLVRLKSDLEALSLTWKVEAKQLNNTQVELVVGRLPRATQGGAHDLVNIADVGFGVSQTLPVIVALIAASKGQIVYLEQPEIHLHPRAQAIFGDLLVRAVRRGVKVVLETHSDLLLRSIQTKIARDELRPDEVGLNWFSRDSITGYTKVSVAELHSDGSFGDWPEDFSEVYLDSETDFMDAATQRVSYDNE
jgi:predicted ATPase